MPPNLDSPEVLGPRKRTLSTKVTSNGDPEVERQQKWLKKVQDKGATTAPTKKRPSTTTAAKAISLVVKQLFTMAAPANWITTALFHLAIHDTSWSLWMGVAMMLREIPVSSRF